MNHAGLSVTCNHMHAEIDPTDDGGGSCSFTSKFSSTMGTDRKLSRAYCNSQTGDAVVTLRKNVLL
jgi:hypothetical protein